MSRPRAPDNGPDKVTLFSSNPSQARASAGSAAALCSRKEISSPQSSGAPPVAASADAVVAPSATPSSLTAPSPQVKRRHGKAHDRSSGVQRYAGKISVARKIFLFKTAADAQPVFCPLQQEDRVFDGFQFEDGQVAGARH